MQYGFVIDHRKCIGCHACTVACKAENDVPVGDFRTWVKYVEKGTFPEVRRHFTVLRCNHCDAAPCVEICPVVALHKRPDAIVDLDRDLCIGCRACMQACPYDALYLNDQTGTAEKCHYCAHRTELGLEPACVVVCPEHAIVAGDAANPASEIAGLIASQPTSQRRVDKGTKPRVWYVDALDDALVPGRPAEPPLYLWSDRRTAPPPVPPGFEPPPDLIASLDVSHRVEWGWHIWVYMLTKNIAAGALLVAPFLERLGVPSPAGTVSGVLPEIVAFLFLGVTGFLLVHDLGRPERFLKILFHPNTKSWLVKGTWALMAFGALAAASLALRLAGNAEAADAVRFANLPLAALASGYTAFLFHQCRGRDLWLERGLFLHLVAQAALMGAAVAMLLPDAGSAPKLIFVAAAVTNAMWIRLGSARPHGNPVGRKAQAILRATRGPLFAYVGLYLAAVFALVPFRGAAESAFRILAALLAAAMLLLYEKRWIESGQKVPNS